MLHENAIEFITEEDTATLSLHRRRFVNRIKKLKKQRPDECDYVENADGTIYAHVPLSWIKITPTRILSDERLEKLRSGAANARVFKNLISTNVTEGDFES